jgi:hypothetical protein
MDADLVLLRPDDVRIEIPVLETPTACAGAATMYVLRRVAYRAGAYAPGIHEHVFDELAETSNGDTIERVHGWFHDRSSMLHSLGYALHCRRVAMPTSDVIGWIERGDGYRGATLATSYSVLHPTSNNEIDAAISHAIGVALENRRCGIPGVAAIDPWSRSGGDPRERRVAMPLLRSAHQDRRFDSLLFYWDHSRLDIT